MWCQDAAERKMSLSRLLSNTFVSDTIVIGNLGSDLEADLAAEEVILKEVGQVEIVTSVDGRKLVPIRYFALLNERLQKEKRRLIDEKHQIQEILLEENRRIEEETRQKAYAEGNQKGYKEGHAKGLHEGQREAREVVASLDGLLQDTLKQRDTLYKTSQQNIINLILEISRKITFDAARIDPEVTAGIIEKVIEKLTDKSRIKIKVHPDHLPVLEQQIERFRGESAAIKELNFEADARVRYGGCFIETPTGDVDVRLETQMDIISGLIAEGQDAT